MLVHRWSSLTFRLQNGVVSGVAQLSNALGYAGLDAVASYKSLHNSSLCSVKVANMVNKAGGLVEPGVASAQAAVRDSASALIEQSLCPGFGLCGNLFDGNDQDVWPLTAVTVSRLTFFSSPFLNSTFRSISCFLSLVQLYRINVGR